MKFAVLAVLVVVTAAAKLPGEPLLVEQPPIAIIRDDRLAPQGASYSTDFETENGIRQSENGQAGSSGQSNAEGIVSYTAPDGQVVEYSYVANEFGYQPQGPFIPTPHPLPAHALAQIAFAEEQARLKAQQGPQ
ncbi:cuticle protein AM1199-like [Panulirus ornatus]|uniref:cuticle protein AM1199-like n=1 Tax=Panulirus ornatus TaxID=150431 RepID=UPI003A8573C1